MNEEEKLNLLELSKKLEERHSEIKGEMVRIVEASKLLDSQYAELSNILDQVEKEYVETIKKLYKS